MLGTLKQKFYKQLNVHEHFFLNLKFKLKKTNVSQTFSESLHWLIANKKTEEIRKYIIKSSKMNKTNINLNICRTEQLIENGVVVVDCLEEKTEETLKTPPKRNFFDLFRRPSYTFHLTLNCYIL